MSVDSKLQTFMTNADEGGSDEPTSQNGAQEEDAYEPQYKLVGTEKIPVSRKYGAIWRSRKDSAIKKLQDNGDDERWDTAIKYYRADQQDRRDSSDIATDKDVGVRLSTKGMESENIVFANVSALVPATYAKNPKVEITSEGRKDLEEFARVLKKLVNIFIGKRGLLGVPLKRLGRKAVISAHLTNYSYMEVGWTQRDATDENTLQDIQKISDQLAKTKNKTEIKQLEAQLMAIDDRVDVLQPAGPFLKLRSPRTVLIDPDADTLTDARWVMWYEFLPNEYILEMYGKKSGDTEDDNYKSIYQPTHVLKVGSNTDSDPIDEQVSSFQMFNTSGEKNAKDYGFDDNDTFKKAQHTKVWTVWDKATRRVYLFNDADWKFPLWVWNDPYGYDEFYPIEQLEFYTDPEEFTARSEVTYYLDQQDALNTINNEVAKTRQFIVGKFIYNLSVLGDDGPKIVESLLDGTNRKRAVGVKLPPDADLSKALVPLVPASSHALNTTIFDRERIIQSIDRVSSVTNVMRGVEYKTNTTNKAIESYESNTQTRLDEKIDAIEDFIGGIGWKLAQLLVKHLEAKDVEEYLGADMAQTWQDNIANVRQLSSAFTVTCVGGSTLKPTSANKKQQAAQLGQILGQFARSSPAAVLVALKTMEKAYDEVIISEEDWEMIVQGVQQSMQQQASAPPGGQGDKPPQGSSAKGQPQQQGPDPGQAIQELIARLNSLPMQLKEELAQAIASNVPIQQAIAEVMQKMAAVNASPNPDMTGA